MTSSKVPIHNADEKKIQESLAYIKSAKWFDVKAYGDSSKLNATGWANHLLIRYLVNSQLQRLGLDPYVDAMLQIIANPVNVSLNGKKEMLLAKNFPAITDWQVWDSYTASWDLSDKFFKDVRLVCKKYEQESKKVYRNPTEAEKAVIYQSYDDLLIERGFRPHDPQRVFVNLTYTDDQLIDDFKNWLKDKRQKLKRNVPANRFTKADFSDWSKYEILGFIDLQMVSKFFGTKLSYSRIGDLLFPDDADVNRPERVRKVVKPLVDRILNSETLDVLQQQAAREKAE